MSIARLSLHHGLWTITLATTALFLIFLASPIIKYYPCIIICKCYAFPLLYRTTTDHTTASLQFYTQSTSSTSMYSYLPYNIQCPSSFKWNITAFFLALLTHIMHYFVSRIFILYHGCLARICWRKPALRMHYIFRHAYNIRKVVYVKVYAMIIHKFYFWIRYLLRKTYICLSKALET